MRRNKLLNVIFLFVLLALIDSSYLGYIHYGNSNNVLCNLSENLNCDKVNNSIYSVFPPGNGVSVALISVFVFAFISILIILIKKKKLNVKIWENIIFYIVLLGFLFSLGLLYVSIFILYSFCLFCLMLDLLILIILILMIILKRK